MTGSASFEAQARWSAPQDESGLWMPSKKSLILRRLRSSRLEGRWELMPPDDITIRAAQQEDVPAIVALLADDPLGAARETPDDLGAYLAAFDGIAAQGGNSILVAER